MVEYVYREPEETKSYSHLTLENISISTPLRIGKAIGAFHYLATLCPFVVISRHISQPTRHYFTEFPV